MRFSILAFSVEKRHFHRKSQFFNRKPPKFECYSGFHGWGIDWKHYFQRLDGPQTQKLRIFTFSLQTLAKIRKNRKNLTINDIQNINFRDKNTRILQN